MTARKPTGISLPSPVDEAGYPDGDGPAWVSEALGVPGCLQTVRRYLSDDGETTTLVLHFTNGKKQRFRPARLILTRRLPEQLGALGFPVPYYQPPQLARLGQAIGRIADAANQDQADDDSTANITSLVAMWLRDCLERHACYVLSGRAGADVRAAIEHVRHGRRHERGAPAPLIAEPVRDALLAWTSPIQTMVRERLGPTSFGDIGSALSEAGVGRERLAARPGPGEKGTQEIPVFVVYNGWQGVDVEMPDEHWPDGPTQLSLLESVVDNSHARARFARTRTLLTQRSTTPNGSQADSINYAALRGDPA